MENQGLLIIALVAVVSVVALVMLSQGSTGAMVYTMSGEGARSFDRPLGSNSADYFNAVNTQCYRAVDGGMFCESAPAGR